MLLLELPTLLIADEVVGLPFSPAMGGARTKKPRLCENSHSGAFVTGLIRLA
jgi:hypothetical protein